MPADPEISFRQQLWVMLKLRLLIFRRDSALIIMGCVYPIIMIGIASGIAGASTNIMASLDSSILNFGLPVLAADLGRSNAFQLNSSSVTNLTFGLILQGAAQPLASALASGYNTLLSAQLPHVPINLEQFTSLSDFEQSVISTYRIPPQPHFIGGWAFNTTLQNATAADGRLDFTSVVISEGSQDSFTFPILAQSTFVVAQSAFSPPKGSSRDIFFSIPSAGLYASPDTIDIGAEVIPAFVVNAVALLLSFHASNMVKEREEKHEQMLFTSGVMPSVYYLSLFLVDCLAFGVSAIASFILLFSIPINFIRASNPLPLILVVLFFGPVTVLLSYILSFAFKSSKSVGPVLGVTVSLVVFVPYFIVDFALKNNVPAVFDFVIGFIIPTFGAYRALVDYALGPINGAPYTLVDTFNINRRVFPMILIFIAQILLYTFLIAVLHHRKATGKRFLVALSEVVSQIRSRKTPSTHHESSAIHPEDLPSTAIVVPAGSAAGAARVTDAEVLRETTKLMSPDFAGTLEDSEYIMAARGINKSFKISGDRTLNVLNNLVMGVKKNECFGFLGPNGAGKTTAINILTGNDFANSGEAFIGGYSVCPHFDPSARRMIGLCPQFNVLWDKLTPREHISAYGELRGIPSSELKAAVDQVISDMGLDDGQNQFTKTLSGGNKRKVSIAISMIGDPKLVFLDEPTTGVDISIRQKIWQGIEKLKERSSIILTSHSMEEVDALSDRIAILINGQLRCLGTSQRLKNVYGSGYKIAVKLSSSSRSQALVDWLPTQIQSIPGLPIQCTVSKMIGSSVEFSLSILSRPAEAGAGEKQSSANYVEDTCILLSTGFQILERSKAEYGIVDYSFSQATLGHVFVELAKEQLSASDLEGSKSSKGGWRPFGLFRSS